MLSLLFFGDINTFAATYEDLTYSISNDEVTIRDCYSWASGKVIIPDFIGGYPVTTIGEDAFSYCDDITDVIIPDTVTTISNGAFRECNSLTNIIIPNSVTTIGYQAFFSCDRITSINIPEGITIIESFMFESCYDLKSVTIPNSVTQIGDGVFYGCDKLENVYYNGNFEDWNRITIGSSFNETLESLSKKFFYYVALFDKDGNTVIKLMQDAGTCFDISSIELPEGYFDLLLYVDKDFSMPYDAKKVVNKNLTLYADVLKFDEMEILGDKSVNAGEKGLVQSITFVTDKKVKYLDFIFKFPDDLTFSEIKSDIFNIEQYSEMLGGETYLYLTCVSDEYIPTKQRLNALELVFDVSESAVLNDVLIVEVLDSAILADDEGNVYTFKNVGRSEIKITPTLIKDIEIVGEEEIFSPTTYSALVLPENATNKEIEWSVSDESVATISADGVLTPIKNGNVTITAMAKDGSSVFATKSVFVNFSAVVTNISTNIGVWDKKYSPSVNAYTIYVSKETQTIKLTAVHSGKLTSPGKTYISTVEKPILLDKCETIIELSYSSSGYEKTYTIKIIKFEGIITTVSEDGKSFVVNLIGIEQGLTVILALYENGKFVEMKSTIYDGTAIPFTPEKTYTDAKIMIWEDCISLKPVREVEIIE